MLILSNGLHSKCLLEVFQELVGLLVGVTWAFLVTYILLWTINKVTPVRVSDAEEQAGLDNALHGEAAYIQQ